MIFRLIVLLLCVVVFINGCNSVISQNFGTHKLRTYTMEQVVSEGIGDADYIEIADAWQTGDFVHGEPQQSNQPDIILYPLVSSAQLNQLKAATRISPPLIAWTEDFDPSCLEKQDCAPTGEVKIRGIVRQPGRERNRSEALSSEKYELPRDPVFIEIGRAPLAWYWNAAMMAGALLLAFLMERSRMKGEEEA